MRTRRAVALGLIALVAGCGGGTSEEEFTGAATDICLEYQEKIDVALRPTLLKDYGPYLDDVIPAARRTRDRIAQLERPAKLDTNVERMLENWSEILDTARDLRGESAAGDFAASLASLERMHASDLEARDAAHDAEIPACAEFAPFTSIE